LVLAAVARTINAMSPINVTSRLTPVEHVTELKRSLEQLQQIADGDLDSSVPSCPGWQTRTLIGHLGRVQRMALAVIATGAMSPAGPGELAPVPDNDVDLRAYFRDSSAQLVSDLETTDPASACWTFLGTTDEVAFWSRRMNHEHSVHLYDALRAIDEAPQLPVSPRSACDAIDEYMLLVNRRVLSKRPDFDLGGTLHLHATDTDEGEWMISSEPGRLVVEASHGKGTAAIRGTAADLLLGLWGRLDLVTDPRYERFGADQVLANMAGIGGN
jgi:uncharacterized protein (TIGR03083 family)